MPVLCSHACKKVRRSPIVGPQITDSSGPERSADHRVSSLSNILTPDRPAIASPRMSETERRAVRFDPRQPYERLLWPAPVLSKSPVRTVVHTTRHINGGLPRIQRRQLRPL